MDIQEQRQIWQQLKIQKLNPSSQISSKKEVESNNYLILVSIVLSVDIPPIVNHLAEQCTETRVRGSAVLLHDIEQAPIIGSCNSSLTLSLNPSHFIFIYLILQYSASKNYLLPAAVLSGPSNCLLPHHGLTTTRGYLRARSNILCCEESRGL